MTRRALEDLKVAVTRPRAQAADFVEALETLGAEVVCVPVIEIVDPADGVLPLRVAVRSLRAGDWLIVTSTNGVERVGGALDGGSLADGVQVAAIGPSTRQRAESLGLSVDLVPLRAVAEGMLEVFPGPPPSGGRVVLARAELAREILPIGLKMMGWTVDDIVAYRTVGVPLDTATAAACGAADVVVFTSSSTVTHLLAEVGAQGIPRLIASIGPATSNTIVARGLRVDVEAKNHTTAGLAEALVDRLGSGSHP